MLADANRKLLLKCNWFSKGYIFTSPKKFYLVKWVLNFWYASWYWWRTIVNPRTIRIIQNNRIFFELPDNSNQKSLPCPLSNTAISSTTRFFESIFAVSLGGSKKRDSTVLKEAPSRKTCYLWQLARPVKQNHKHVFFSHIMALLVQSSP